MGPPLTEIVLTLTRTIIFIDLLITSLTIASVSSSGLDALFTGSQVFLSLKIGITVAVF